MTATSAVARTKGEARARALGLRFEEQPAPKDGLHLLQSETSLILHDPLSGARVCVEFEASALRRYRPGVGPNPLRRALGASPRRIVDATAGLGTDAVHMTLLGYQVIAVERNPIVAALAMDGIERARAVGLLARDNPAWHVQDAREFLPSLAPAPDTVFLDPMFPPKRKKSAAVRKEMRLLRALVGDDVDVVELLNIALDCATDRVVIKRPVDAPTIGPAPKAAYRGKLVRYDVYGAHRPRRD